MPPRFKLIEAILDAIGALIIIALIPLALAIISNAEADLILMIGGAQ